MDSEYVLRGERVGLGPLRHDLADRYRRWANDVEVKRGVANLGLYALEAEQAWLDGAIERSAGHEPAEAGFTVYDISDDTPVGTCSLFQISWPWRRAMFGILLGDRRGQGLGTEATVLTLRWAFSVLGLHNVMLGVMADNAAAIRAYEKAGFREIGRRRNAVMLFGEITDEVLMDAVPSRA